MVNATRTFGGDVTDDQDFPRLPVGTVINGVTWDGSQFRYFNCLCGPDPRLFPAPPATAPQAPSDDDFLAIMNGSVRSSGVRPLPED